MFGKVGTSVRKNKFQQFYRQAHPLRLLFHLNQDWSGNSSSRPALGPLEGFAIPIRENELRKKE